jgi:hypothetical protein
MRRVPELMMAVLTAFLVTVLLGCGQATEEDIAKETPKGQPEGKLKALPEEEMKKLLPDSWPDDWHVFVQRIGEQKIEHCTFSQADDGGLVCVLLLQKGTATKDGMPTQQANLKIYDLLDPFAEEQFAPEDRTDKGPDGTVVMIYEAITFNGHKAQLVKLPGMKDMIDITYRSGRFEIRVQNPGGQGIGMDDLEKVCSALKLPKQ